MFLPISKKDMINRQWDQVDFILISGDAYIDHPSFGVAIIARVLDAMGYKVAILPQPNIQDEKSFLQFGVPRLAFLVSAGNIDSMVNHYTVAKKRRTKDYYTPGGKMGKRPDNATITYSKLVRKIFPNSAIIIGGIEASLRRFAHYDYLQDRIRPSILLESQADLLVYGMAEQTIIDLAEALDSGINISQIDYLKGTVVKKNGAPTQQDAIILPSFKTITSSKNDFAKSYYVQYQNSDAFMAKTLIEPYDDFYIIQNKPALPLSQAQFDWVYSLNYQRAPHPSYQEKIPAIEEVQHSLIVNRGCFGNCSFCALAMHQGRIIQSRSKAAILEEAKVITQGPDFKGYIHDVGGPTANFYQPACRKQATHGACVDKQCLFPNKCNQLEVSHTSYLDILRSLRSLKGVKKVFIRSGIRYDYVLHDSDPVFFEELVEHHVSGQLKVAPEHVSQQVLRYMQKPPQTMFDRFVTQYQRLNQKYKKDQYLIPYFMSSHPGSTLEDSILLAQYIQKNFKQIEQVQDFYPTPGTLATCMYYTEIDPRTMEQVYVAKNPREKAIQRALLQFQNPSNYSLVYQGLVQANRRDLIGYDKHCLIKPRPYQNQSNYRPARR